MTTTAVEFDPFSDEYFDDPTEVYRRLRDEAPVYFSERTASTRCRASPTWSRRTGTGRGSRATHGVDLSTLTGTPR